MSILRSRSRTPPRSSPASTHQRPAAPTQAPRNPPSTFSGALVAGVERRCLLEVLDDRGSSPPVLLPPTCPRVAARTPGPTAWLGHGRVGLSVTLGFPGPLAPFRGGPAVLLLWSDDGPPGDHALPCRGGRGPRFPSATTSSVTHSHLFFAVLGRCARWSRLSHTPARMCPTDVLIFVCLHGGRG